MPNSERILCVENDRSLLSSRCKVLESAGYETSKASAAFAEIILSSQKFDLIVISNATEVEVNRIMNVSDGAGLLVVAEFTSPHDMLLEVADRLQRVRKQRA
jgi:CheY-like chemotaxis protein